ncbi:MAG: hypothetical protein ACEPOV_12235 [Hyphomicrobiales bacterium]
MKTISDCNKKLVLNLNKTQINKAHNTGNGKSMACPPGSNICPPPTYYGCF